ncbi:MAG TPA: ectonucleotide pyrophosphatase/phosphodiesterase [Longimicrobiales bacterium]
MNRGLIPGRFRRATTILPVALAAACASAGYIVPAADADAPLALVSEAVAARGVTSHVVVVSIDGLRPDAIERFGARTLQRLMAEGSYSLEAKTILPSKTLPSHTSMLTGVEPDAHGVTWNSEEMEVHGHVATPTIFAAAKQAGYRTAAFFSKEKFEHLAVPGTLDHVQIPGGLFGKSMADATVDHVERYLRGARPNLLFVHIGEPDFAGHLFGWMSTPYGWAVRTADQQLAELIAATDRAFGAGNYALIVTADHGGHGRDHGSDDARDVTIPWIAWGEGITAGTVLPRGISTVDTAPTALRLLGVEPTAEIAGVVVAGAIEIPVSAPVAGLGR